jgi:hypothetical protein
MEDGGWRMEDRGWRIEGDPQLQISNFKFQIFNFQFSIPSYSSILNPQSSILNPPFSILASRRRTYWTHKHASVLNLFIATYAYAGGTGARSLRQDHLEVFEMVTKSLKRMTALVLIMIAMTAIGFAQGPMQKRVLLTINVPYQLRMGGYLLSAGKYSLYQVSQNDPNLFYLSRGDMRHSPIASIRTVRVDHSVSRYPGKPHMRWQLDEESSTPALTVVTGWEIPGEDGWEIISVVSRHAHGAMTASLR